MYCSRATPSPVRAVSQRAALAARRLTVLAVIVLALGSCSVSFAENTVPDPSGTVAMRTSGAIADGFEIEPGSALIGGVFPAAGYGEGHEAVLRVEGDVQSALDGYVRQAEELDFSFDREAGAGGERCRVPARTGDALPECTAQGVKIADRLEAFVTMRALVEPDGRGLILLSTTFIEGPGPSPLPTAGPVAPVTDVELAPGLTPESYRPPLRVVEGSAIVVGPIEQSRAAGGGYVVMLEVTGDLLPVMRGYLEQLPAVFGTPGFLGDANEPRFVGDSAGGGDLIAVGVAGEPSYVLIALIEGNG
jgi:hypothetical protein